MINTQQNYFQLFTLAEEFNLDLQVLQAKFRNLQTQFHPDNFIGREAAVTNQALIASSWINEAYTTLLNPLSRTIYLLQLVGIKVDLIHETNFSPEFLMAQIELREAISDSEAANDIDKLEDIEQKLKYETNNLLSQISLLFQAKNYLHIVGLVKELAFYTKLEQLVNDILSN